MTVKQKAYKFRLSPNREQKLMFTKTFGSSRAIWNMMLADKIKYYEETGKTLKNTPAQYKHTKISSEEISDGREYSLLFSFSR